MSLMFEVKLIRDNGAVLFKASGNALQTLSWVSHDAIMVDKQYLFYGFHFQPALGTMDGNRLQPELGTTISEDEEDEFGKGCITRKFLME